MEKLRKYLLFYTHFGVSFLFFFFKFKELFFSGTLFFKVLYSTLKKWQTQNTVVYWSIFLSMLTNVTWCSFLTWIVKVIGLLNSNHYQTIKYHCYVVLIVSFGKTHWNLILSLSLSLSHTHTQIYDCVVCVCVCVCVCQAAYMSSYTHTKYHLYVHTQ